jgi:putative phage-type endonuclease
MITPEQRESRKLGIGASDSPIIMGYSSYKTPYQLYLEKRGVVTDEDEETELQYWGNALEPAILKRFEEENNVTITRPDTIHHPNFPQLFANLDGWIESERAVVEVKCANSFQRKEWDMAAEDGMPLHYLIQVAKQVAVADAVRGYCAVLIGGNEYKQFVYERDLSLEATILESDLAFWDCVQKGIEPDPINTNDCRLKFPRPESNKVARSTFKTTNALIELQDLKAKIKNLEKSVDHYKMHIMSHMGVAEYLIEQEGEVVATWKANKKGVRTLLLKGL